MVPQKEIASLITKLRERFQQATSLFPYLESCLREIKKIGDERTVIRNWCSGKKYPRRNKPVTNLTYVISLESVYNGTVCQSMSVSVADDVFKRTKAFAFGRATRIMNTKSRKDFEWSVKLIGDQHFHVGIATQLPNKGGHITGYDSEAILYSSDGNIRVGNKTKYRMDVEQKSEDIINFIFRSRIRKLSITTVST